MALTCRAQRDQGMARLLVPESTMFSIELILTYLVTQAVQLAALVRTRALWLAFLLWLSLVKRAS